MESSGDDLDDFDFIPQAIVKRCQVAIKFLLGLSINLSNWNDFNRFIRFKMMNIETVVFVLSLLLLVFICHTFEFWFAHLTRRLPIKWRVTCSSLVSSKRSSSRCELSANEVEELKLDNIGIYAIQGRRPRMEDKFTYIKDNRSLIEIFAVYDGHGGDSASIYVKSKLGDAILRRVEQYVTSNGGNRFENTKDACCVSQDYDRCKVGDEIELDENVISDIINQEILSVDKNLCGEIRKKRDVAGTTVLLAIRILKPNQLVVANVGDSRGVLCDNRGNVIPVSFDHKPQQLKERKRIKEAGGFISFNGVWRVAGTLATSRALGDYPLKDKNLVIADPDILTFDLNVVQPRFMLLASDGLWDTFTNEEAVSYVKTTLDAINKKLWRNKDVAFDVAKSIVDEAYKRGSLDNITAILVLFDKNSFIKHPVVSYSSRFKRRPNSLAEPSKK